MQFILFHLGDHPFRTSFFGGGGQLIADDKKEGHKNYEHFADGLNLWSQAC